VGFASRYFAASQDVGAMVQGLLPLLARPYAPTTSTPADDAAPDDHGDAAWRHGTVEIHTFLIGQPDGGVDLATATDPVLRRCARARPAAAPPHCRAPFQPLFTCIFAHIVFIIYIYTIF
jgi:hypothetical protein